MRAAFFPYALVFAATSSIAAPTEAPKPNVIFILADDLGYGDLGCYGQKMIQTPEIDRLAREGRLFTDFYAGSTVCAPSRCVLMTGLHTGHARIRGNALDPLLPEDVTVAEVLKKAGYTTGIIGKWGLGEAGSTGIPTRQGFDYFFGYLNQVHAHNYYPEFLWRNEEKVRLRNVVERRGRSPFGGVATKRVDYSHDLFTQEALAFIEKHRSGPFFLYLAYTIPHANNEAGKKGMEVPDLGIYADRDWPEPQKAHAAMISRLDRDVGRILRRLKELGIDEKTLVFFSSDNGPHSEGGARSGFFDSNGPLRGMKRDLYEGGIRVPMIVRWPGHVPAGTRTNEVGAFWDILPTLAELAGVEPPAGLDGISLVPALLGREQKAKHPYLYWAFYERGGAQAARWGKWKGIAKPAGGPIELYDLETDIGESRNLAREHPEIVERMRAIFREAYTPSPRWKFPHERRAERARVRGGKAEAPVQRKGPSGRRPAGADAARGPSPARTAKGGAGRPNFIFVLVDDLGWTDVGYMGSPLYETPNIDRLRAEGMMFTDAYSACTVCSPSRAAVLTGKYPATLRVTDWIPGHGRPRAKLKVPDWTQHLPHEEITIAEALREAGYRTAHVGKWHLGREDSWPEKHGFEVNVAGYHRGQPPSYFSPYRIPTLKDGPPGEYLTDRECEEALRFIEADRSNPFFLYLAHYAVHTPLQAKRELIEKYRRKVQPGWKHRNPVYAAMIESVDQSLGRIMAKLAELGIDGRTVIFFTSDNGGLLGRSTDNSPLRAGKGSSYEGGVRVPLVIKWPGVAPAGSTSHEPVIGCDYYPTILEIAGLKPDPSHRVEGVSLVPILRSGGKASLGRKAIYWHYPHYHPGGATPYGAVRAGRWKLIEFYEDWHIELYDLAADISESRDLAQEKPEKAEELRRLLHEWRAKVKAQMPTPNPNYDPKRAGTRGTNRRAGGRRPARKRV